MSLTLVEGTVTFSTLLLIHIVAAAAIFVMLGEIFFVPPF